MSPAERRLLEQNLVLCALHAFVALSPPLSYTPTAVAAAIPCMSQSLGEEEDIRPEVEVATMLVGDAASSKRKQDDSFSCVVSKRIFIADLTCRKQTISCRN